MPETTPQAPIADEPLRVFVDTLAGPAQQEFAELQQALGDACAFAIAEGVDDDIEPAAFAFQRSAPSTTCATYVSDDHVVSVTIARGQTIIAVGEIDWFAGKGGAWPRPMVDVHLPGDAPAEANR